MDGLKVLFQSRRFKVLLGTVVADLLVMLGAHRGLPKDLCVNFAGLITLAAIVYMGGTALEDYGEKRAGGTPPLNAKLTEEEAKQ